MNFFDWFVNGGGRAPEGLFSFAHLFSVTLTLAILLTLAVFLAKKFKNNQKAQNITLIITAALVVFLEIIKLTVLLITTDNVLRCLLGNMPLYFCDIMMYVIPVCVLVKGRAKEICYDFIAICGLLMGFMGNYFAGNIYGNWPAFSFYALNSLFNHSLSAFAALFVWLCKLNKMEKRNIPFTIGILFVFMTVALLVNYGRLWASGNAGNYMFFFSGDGTPYSLFLSLFQGNLIIYQIFIYVLQCGYIGLFYAIYYPIAKRIAMHKAQNKQEEQPTDAPKDQVAE